MPPVSFLDLLAIPLTSVCLGGTPNSPSSPLLGPLENHATSSQVSLSLWPTTD